jgi:hypothetical protein
MSLNIGQPCFPRVLQCKLLVVVDHTIRFGSAPCLTSLCAAVKQSAPSVDGDISVR